MYYLKTGFIFYLEDYHYYLRVFLLQTKAFYFWLKLYIFKRFQLAKVMPLVKMIVVLQPKLKHEALSHSRLKIHWKLVKDFFLKKIMSLEKS